MLKPIIAFLIVSILSLVFFHSSYAGSSYNVVSLGAKAGGETDTTQAFLKAWARACASVGSAMIYVPPGKYLLNRSVFDGKDCRNNDIKIRIDGTLMAPSDYRVLGSSDYWLRFQDVNGVSIYGGTLDGQGSSLWDCKTSGKSCPTGAKSLTFESSKNIVINGLSSINSQLFHIVIDNCRNVNMRGVKIAASGDSPNTDGIHVESSMGVTILSSSIKTGDDSISIGPATTNLWIQNVECGPGHGISIGSLGKSFNEVGVQNVTVKTVTLSGTDNGLRIKTWARPSNAFVKGVLFEDAIMNNVKNPIIIDQNYCPRQKNCPNQVSGVKISQVAYKNIRGTSATQIAVKFDCSPKNPCTAITVEDVKLTYNNANQAAKSSCTNVGGKVSGLVQPTSCL
ncbi:PREDICTED: polygalacturonase-like [Nelumbo nucifera]|uniref:Polygalacturonase-like n=2 Tax=Nelumbo nucifera TaxID=4432 RepID=A0A1U7YQX0_NELNU|nr:PREDICTED: polygalacturonase-like [Nelumbo nucifera]DAD25133.1 TPA_asm: hypothetical protein HUJ06_026597 [Nelumbo nucifera]